MHERNRYRITGSIFLIALAVIFLPMLFDGAGVAVQEAPPMPQVAVNGAVKNGAAGDPLRSATNAADYTEIVPDYDDAVPATNVVSKVDTLRDELTEDGFTTADGTLFGEPKLLPVDRDTAIWAVQAASFAKQENAQAFRERLRGAGFEAFISTVKSRRNNVLYRVAVGPLLNKADADAMLAVIADRFTVQPAVMEMQP